MARPKGGLGKGLDSLFADMPETTESEAGVATLPLREIEPDPAQPRKVFAQEALAELSASIAQAGLLQPIAVRPQKAGSGYIIIAGERRWRAARMAGLAEVPVVIRDVSEEQAAALALIENLQREDLDPLEEAEGFHRLMETYGLTQEQAAEKVGKSRSALANSLRLLGLPEPVRKLLREGKISTGHAKVLLGLPNAKLMAKAAEQAAQKNLSVRQTEALCKLLAKPAKPAKNEDAFRRPRQATEVELALKEVTGSEVKVDYKKGRGTLQIAFYSDEQLAKFAELLGRYNPEG